jgi:predicted phosphate transport protein (TIGR00153 family)
MMTFLSRLMPRERRFFELFDQHGSLVVEASQVLVDLLRNFDEHALRNQRIARILELEHAADKVTRETVSLLHQTFVTPLDRDDIHRLISRMDDVLDLIQDTAEALQLYDIQRLTPEATQLAELLAECCTRMHSAVKQLSRLDDAALVLRLCNEIDGLESQADRVMRAAVSKLFREESDTRQLIKLENVYQLLESATDQCENVANVIEGVVLENA